MVDDLTTAAASLRELLEDKKTKKADKIEAANSIIREVSLEDVESLRDELESWRDGMSGTNLENTEKYSMLEEAISALESVETEFDEVGAVDEIEHIADRMDDVINELEGIEFPGMYS
jgi:hypothetical protein